MTSRLDYETAAGNLSPSATYAQLEENLRLAIEDLTLLSQSCAARSDRNAAEAWAHIVKNFGRTLSLVHLLAQSRANPSSTGYRDAN